MAGYVPPVGIADLNLSGAYVPPVGIADLDLASAGTDRQLSIAARTAGATSAIRVRLTARVTVAAKTGGARAVAAVAYDPNLLSAVHAVFDDAARDARPEPFGAPAAWRDSERLQGGGPERWRAAAARPGSAADRWADSARLPGEGIGRWRQGAALADGPAARWVMALPRLDLAPAARWSHGAPAPMGTTARWVMTLPRLEPTWAARWARASAVSRGVTERFGDGRFLVAVEIERWRPAGYPGNAANPGPSVEPPHPPPWGTALDIACPLPVSPGEIQLRIGRSPCPLVPAVSVPIKKVYRVLNSCSLVRLPDRAPLAVTAMTVETDADSWCWALSATLAGPDGWALLQPQPPAFLPVEVEAAINGHVWRFLLDTPSASRKFNENRQSLKGRSRSAWLADPFTAPSSGVEAHPRTAQQLAEQALENLGWSLVWELPVDWLVPGGLYSWSGTPIDQLVSLVKPVDGCLYTDPSAAILTAYPRYPSPSWLWDGQTADVGIPESAVISLDRSPENRPVLNGCYVSGTLHGYTAWVKVAGTDGALVPAEPIVDPLLCHADALRARGVAVLSAAGPGHALSAELLLTAEGGTGPGLLRPGLLAEIAGVRGMVRSVRVSASWSSGLQVRQQVGIERREIEN